MVAIKGRLGPRAEDTRHRRLRWKGLAGIGRPVVGSLEPGQAISTATSAAPARPVAHISERDSAPPNSFAGWLA